MTFENSPEAPETEERKIYMTNEIRDAAKELSPPTEEPTVVSAGEEAPAEMTLREARDKYHEHEKAVEADRASIDKAMGIGVEEPSPPSEIEQLRTKVEQLEQSREPAPQVQQVAHEADAEVQWISEQHRQRLYATLSRNSFRG